MFVCFCCAQRSGISKVITHLDLVDMDITHGNLGLCLFVSYLMRLLCAYGLGCFTRATEHEVELELDPGR